MSKVIKVATNAQQRLSSLSERQKIFLAATMSLFIVFAVVFILRVLGDLLI